MISKDEDLVFVVFQVMVSSFKNLNNGWEFLIVDCVLRFCQNHLFKKKTIGYY